MHLYHLNFYAKGHIFPTLPIMRELMSRDIRVTSYALPEYREVFTNAGIEFRPYHTRQQQEETAMQLAAYQTLWAGDILPSILTDIEREQPTAIITDSMLPLGAYVARIAKLPLIVSTSHFVASETILNALGVTDDQFLRSGDQGSFDNDQLLFQQAVDTLQSQYDIDPLRARDTFQIPGDLSLVTTSSTLQPHSELLDETYKFVGAMIETRNTETEFPFDELDAENIVYVSLGTMVSDLDIFRIFPEAFKDAPYQIVVSSGGQKIELNNLPKNMLYFEFVPQLEILQRVDVFVTHAGWNSVNESLYYNVPMVACPVGKDQFMNAGVIEKLGLGKALMELKSTELRAAVDTVLADKSYRQRSTAIGETLRTAGGASRAADEIIAFLA